MKADRKRRCGIDTISMCDCMLTSPVASLEQVTLSVCIHFNQPLTMLPQDPCVLATRDMLRIDHHIILRIATDRHLLFLQPICADDPSVFLETYQCLWTRLRCLLCHCLYFIHYHQIR